MAHVEDRWARADRKGTGKRWRVRYTDPGGAERSRSFDRKADATAFMNGTAADVARGTWTDPDAGKLTLRRYVEQVYLPAQTTEASTQESTETKFRLHILPALGDKTLGQLAAEPSTVKAWAAGLSRELSTGYVRVIFASLSACLSAAVADGKISRNPCGLVKPPKAEHGRVRPWETAQAEAVRDALPARYRAMADLGSGLGMRQGEVLGLAADDVDFLHRVVHVRRQVRIVGSRLLFAPPKGGKERDIPLPSSIALRLSAHIAACPPVAVELPWKEPGGRPVTVRLLFTTAAGGAIRRSTWNVHTWKPALAAAGVPNSRENGFHALRHHFASALLSRGVDIRALSAYLGHHDPAFTLRVYVHLMPDAADRMRQAVDAAFAADGPATAQGVAE